MMIIGLEKESICQRRVVTHVEAGILFREFPDIKTAFSLTHSLRMIFSQRCTKEKGRTMAVRKKEGENRIISSFICSLKEKALSLQPHLRLWRNW